MGWGDEPYALPWQKWLGKGGEGMVACGTWPVNLVLLRHSPGSDRGNHGNHRSEQPAYKFDSRMIRTCDLPVSGGRYAHVTITATEAGTNVK